MVYILEKYQEDGVPMLGIDIFTKRMEWVAIGKHCLFDALESY